MKMKLLAVVLLFGAGFTQAAEVYKCTDDRGRMSFSQKPCGGDAEKIEVKAHDKMGSVSADAEAFDRIEGYSRVREIDREVSKRRDLIDRYEKRRDREFAKIKAKQNRANNNLAGATWLQSLAQEMRAVTEKYNAKVAREESAIDRLNRERDRLQL